MNKPEKEPKKGNRKGLLIRILGYIMQHKLMFLTAIILTLLSNQLALLGPLYSGDAIDAMAAEGGVRFDLVTISVVKMLLCYIFAGITSYVLSVLLIKISQKIVYTMRRQLFEKLTSLPVGFFDTTATGDIVSRISYDIDTLNTSISHNLVQVMTSLYTVIGSMIFMWNISRPLMLVFVVTVPISILFAKYRSQKVRPMFRERSKKLGELNGYAEEMIEGQRVVKVFCREEIIKEGFRDINDRLRIAGQTSQGSSVVLMPMAAKPSAMAGTPS